MKLHNLLGVTAIGGLVYLHRKRGGEWTLESFQDSLRQLWKGVQNAADQARAEGKRELHEMRERVENAAGTNGRL
ncbi:MAG TPA: hypothetical protein VMJ10_02420 [Kofleriaceae bacterium]|nr:hypothetical protein [Kofleriaceae bacterium]